MGKLIIERTGGVSGFGGNLSHLKSMGEVNTDDLTEGDQQAVEDLFAGKPRKTNEHLADGFMYKLTRAVDGHPVQIIVEEDAVPQSLKNSVTDQII